MFFFLFFLTMIRRFAISFPIGKTMKYSGNFRGHYNLTIQPGPSVRIFCKDLLLQEIKKKNNKNVRV